MHLGSRRHTAALAALLALCALLYWPGLNGPLILDDAVNLDILRLLDDARQLTLANVLAERGGVVGGRPLSWLTFVLNWRATPGDVWSFKLVNLILHLVNGVLVFGLARVLLTAAGVANPARSGACALAAAALWLLTPIQVSSVLYVVQRMTLLSALFSLLGLLLYCQGRLMATRRPCAGTVLVAVSLLVCWPLAVLAKQNGALLVLLLLATETLVLAPARPHPRWPLRLLAGVAAAVVAAGALRAALDPRWIMAGYDTRDFSLVERVLTQPRVLVDYLLNVAQLPGGSPLGLFHDDFPLSTGPLSPPATLPALAAWIAVPIAGWWLRGRPAGLPMFGLVFFAVAHSLEAGPFALEIYFEHRNYLPSVGIAIAAGAVLALLAPRMRWPVLLPAVACAILLWHGGVTFARVLAWTSWDGIIALNAAAHPASPRARAGAAIQAFTAGRLEEGLTHLQAVRRFGGPRMEPGVTFKTLAGHCLAARAPPPEVYAAVASPAPLVDHPYTLAALRWYRSLAAGGACTVVDTVQVAELVSRRVWDLPEPGPHAAAWVLHDEAARLLEHAGRPAAAAAHLHHAAARAPTSHRGGMMRRLERVERTPRGG